MKIFIAIIAFLIASSIFTTCAVKNIKFEQKCVGHLKRAANANTIDLAKVELQTALDYLERHDITSGYTSVIYRTPDEDVSFFYNNLKSSKAELDSLPADVSPLERSNMLMKLRETLLDNTSEGTRVTKPDGLSRYPNNVSWALLNTFQFLCWCLFIGLIVFIFED